MNHVLWLASRACTTGLKHGQTSRKFSHFRSLPIRSLEPCQNAEWKALLEENCSSWRVPSHNAFRQSNRMEYVMRHLQRVSNDDGHLASCFMQLTKVSDSTLQWPSIVSSMFADAASYGYPNTDKSVSADEKQPLLLEALNHLNYNLIFNKELTRLKSFRREPVNSFASKMASNYFTSEAIYRVSEIRNCQVTWLMASAIESLTRTRHNNLPDYRQLRTLHDWEYEVFHPQGTIVANGCRAAVEIANHLPKVAELGFQFGRFLTLAIKANADIQQILNYQNSISSTFALNSLPVVLHLERNPETLLRIYLSKEPLDNIDLYQIFSSVESSNAIDLAKKQLSEYVHTVVAIASEFKPSKAAINLISLAEVLNKFDE